MLIRMKKAQGATEYAIFIAAVLAGLLALQVYYKRAVQGNTKSRADSIGEQFSMDNYTFDKSSHSISSRQTQTGSASANGWMRSSVTDGTANGVDDLRDNVATLMGSATKTNKNAGQGVITGGEVSFSTDTMDTSVGYESTDNVWTSR